MLVKVRPSNEALLRARVPGAQDQRGCPSNAFLSWGLCEQKWHLTAPSSFGVRPIGLVNRKDPLSLDGFEGPGTDVPETYNPYLHDANTIVASQHK